VLYLDTRRPALCPTFGQRRSHDEGLRAGSSYNWRRANLSCCTVSRWDPLTYDLAIMA